MHIGFFHICAAVLVQGCQRSLHASMFIVLMMVLCDCPRFLCLCHVDCVRLVRLVLLWVSQKLVSATLARLPRITKRQAVARQCHNGNAGSSAQVRSAKVWQSYSLLSQLSYVVLHPQCVVVEFLCPQDRKVPFRAYPGTRPPVCQGHVHSIVSGHIPWFQSVAGIPSSCNWAGVRVSRSQRFTFLRYLLNSLGWYH